MRRWFIATGPMLAIAAGVLLYWNSGRLKGVDVRSFGAIGDGITFDTAAIQRAIDMAALGRGRGIVILPAGQYLSGALHLHSHVHLQLAGDAVLQASDNPADFPIISGRYEGTAQLTHAPLIGADDCQDVSVEGTGTIDGAGKRWWDDWERTKHKIDHPRPHILQFQRCTGVTVKGVKLQNSPSWTLHPVYCRHVLIDGVTIIAPVDSPNTDGIDPDSCSDVSIENCHISCGDDCIAIKSGKDAEGRNVNIPSSGIRISHCDMTAGLAGVALGSEMSGGVFNVRIEHCRFSQTLFGLRLKTRRGRGGAIHDVVCDDIQMDSVGTPLLISMFYSERRPDLMKSEPIGPGTPAIVNVEFSHITATAADLAGEIVGLPERSIENLRLREITLSAQQPIHWLHVSAVEMSGVRINTPTATSRPQTKARVDPKIPIS